MVGDPKLFYIIGTFPGANETEALDNAARDPGAFSRNENGKMVGYDSIEHRNTVLGFTRDNYRVKKVED